MGTAGIGSVLAEHPTQMLKTLDQKLASIHANPTGSKAFILADAKDADMAFGVGAPGLSPEAHPGELKYRSLAEYRDQIRQIVRQGLVDIMLMSASTNQLLTIDERLFDDSPITPAARANDATDIHIARGGRYTETPSRPFRTATLDHIQCGHIDCQPDERARGANLGLYSITFNNRADDDLVALESYKSFRIEAERKGFRHFLEVFDPNVGSGLDTDKIPAFVNDNIARTLAGVPQSARPVFLKIVYHGPKAMEELVSYDPHLVVGVLGGGAGTTYDAFKLLAEAKKYGARAALFGRKINSAECQLAFVEFLRMIADGLIEPEEAVKAYHGVLQELQIRPHRQLEEDLMLQTSVMSYGSATASVVMFGRGQGSEVRGQEKSGQSADCLCGCATKNTEPCACSDAASPTPYPRPLTPDTPPPDFGRMTRQEKLAWNKARRDRIFGS